MSLAAIIVHYQNPTATLRLIDILQHCDVIETIVLVSHDTFQPVNQRKVLGFQEPNKGYAAGLNFAMNHLPAEMEDVLAINPDVIPDCGNIQKLYSQHKKANAGCTFPLLKEKNRVVHGYRFSRFGSLRNTADAEWFSGACFIFTREAWRKTEGFDESFFHYYEDRDFCLRIRKAGLTLYQANDVVLEHQAKSGQNYPETALPKYAIRNHLLSLERSHLLGPATFVNVVLRNFAYLFRWKHGWRGIIPWFQGIQEFLTSDHSRVVE